MTERKARSGVSGAEGARGRRERLATPTCRLGPRPRTCSRFSVSVTVTVPRDVPAGEAGRPRPWELSVLPFRLSHKPDIISDFFFFF